ncbi:MAG: hypothetical protein ACP5KI_01750 [Brevinematia bacterium]
MQKPDLVKEIGFLDFIAKKEIFSEFYKIADLLKREDPNVVLGIALIKTGFVLPGFRLLYRFSSVDKLKEIFPNIVISPQDIFNIFFQISTLNDSKLSRFISSLGILPKDSFIDVIKEYNIKEVVVNAIPTDIRCAKYLNNLGYYYINYYVEESDNEDRLAVLINGNKFYLSPYMIYFVESGPIDIELKEIFNFGFPEERVFLSVKKDHEIVNSEAIYFDPIIKIESALHKIDSNKPVEFFYDFLNLLLNEFDLVNSEVNKRKIINALAKKRMLWILVEMKNIISDLSNSHHSNVLKNLVKNVEFFIKGWEFDILLRNAKIIKIITPLFDIEKYTSRGYLLNCDSNVMLVFEGNDIKVILKNNGIVIGEINPNTSRLISEMQGKILSVKLLKNRVYKPLDNPLPKFYEFWLEMEVSIP